MKPWHEYVEGLRYIRSIPLVFALMMVGVGWAGGGGAAQVLFSLFGERVFHRGAAGIGELWGVAGLGLVVGGFFGHRIMARLSYTAYKRTIAIVYLLHGAAYVLFSLMTSYGWALFFLALSRAAVAVSSWLPPAAIWSRPNTFMEIAPVALTVTAAAALVAEPSQLATITL